MPHTAEPRLAGPDLMTVGDVAHRLGCREWRLRLLYTRGVLPEPSRVGGRRAIPATDLPAIREALIAAGYLSEEG